MNDYWRGCQVWVSILIILSITCAVVSHIDCTNLVITLHKSQTGVLFTLLSCALSLVSIPEPIQRAVGDSLSIIQHHGQSAPTHPLKFNELAWLGSNQYPICNRATCRASGWLHRFDDCVELLTAIS